MVSPAPLASTPTVPSSSMNCRPSWAPSSSRTDASAACPLSRLRRNSAGCRASAPGSSETLASSATTRASSVSTSGLTSTRSASTCRYTAYSADQGSGDGRLLGFGQVGAGQQRGGVHRRESGSDVDRQPQYFLRCVRVDLLDIHPTLDGEQDEWTLAGRVVEDGGVQLACDRDRLLHEHRGDREPVDRRPEQVRRGLLRLRRGVGESDGTGLAALTGRDLRLDDDASVEGACDRRGLAGFPRHRAVGSGEPALGEQAFSLVFKKFHDSPSVGVEVVAPQLLLGRERAAG